MYRFEVKICHLSMGHPDIGKYLIIIYVKESFSDLLLLYYC